MDTKQSLANVITEAIEACYPGVDACRMRLRSPTCWKFPAKRNGRLRLPLLS